MSDQLPSPELLHNIDMLNPRIQMHLTMPIDVYSSIPKVIPGDQIERFALFLGEWNMIGPESVHVRFQAVLEDADGRYIKGEKFKVESPDLQFLENTWVKEIKSAIPEYAQSVVLGEVHTHPDTEEVSPDSQDKIFASPTDMEGWIYQYEHGMIPRTRPFVFAISGKTGTEEDQINFYRLYTPRPGTYAYKLLDRVNVESEEVIK